MAQFSYSLILMIILGVTVPTVSGFSINTNENQYYYGDAISVYGTVSPTIKDTFVGLRIVNPANSDIVAIDQFIPNSDGTFSRNYLAQGPKWQMEGFYTITIFYGEKSMDKKIVFQKIPDFESSPLQDTKKNTLPSTGLVNPKLLVRDFPSVDKSPQYYFDRYYNEIEFKNWFDQVFPGKSIEEVVGYKQSHVKNYPDSADSPKYHVDRYSKEPQYKEWFDQQFPGQTIYDVLGYPESTFHKIPNWIKNTAKWWSTGLISDSDFFKGIEFLISEKIIVVDAIPTQQSSIQTIPNWIKNTAKWWSEGLIEENDFLNSIEFLIENKVILV